MKGRKRLFCVAALAGILSAMMALAGLAAVRGTDVTVPAQGNVLVGIEGTFYRLSPDEVLAYINRIRKEACDEGVWNPSDPTKKLTSADYVPIRWSAGLEEIAQTRAAEANVYRDHTRPNQTDCFTLKASNGVSSWGEVLAWNGIRGTDAILRGIDQWYAEKEGWVKYSTNISFSVTGHYTQMIDPSNIYVGIGCFLKQEGSGWTTVSGEFSSGKEAGAAGLTGVSGAYTQMIEVPQSELSIGMEDQEIHTGSNKQLEMRLDYEAARVVMPENVTVTWTSSDPGVVEVTSDGTATGLSEGSADVTVSAFGQTATAKITSAHEWSSWVITRAATKGTEGTQTRTCPICGAKETRSFTNDFDVKLSKTRFIYTGKRVRPSLKYVKSGGKKLTRSQYRVTYTNDRAIGYAFVTVTGKGRYAGKRAVLQYRIDPPKEKITSLKAKKGYVAVRWKKVTACDGYQISVSRKSSFKNASVITVNKPQTSFTRIRDLLSGKQYYVRVRAFKISGSRRLYGAWSDKKKIKVK